jgi:hypothetical protein
MLFSSTSFRPISRVVRLGAIKRFDKKPVSGFVAVVGRVAYRVVPTLGLECEAGTCKSPCRGRSRSRRWPRASPREFHSNTGPDARNCRAAWSSWVIAALNCMPPTAALAIEISNAAADSPMVDFSVLVISAPLLTE